MYRFTAIGRPLDMRYPTNQAVAILAPVAGLAAAVVTAVQAGELMPTAAAGISGAAVTFGAWAVTRELAPDNDPAAFVAMAFGLTTLLVVESSSVLLLFAALFLVRIVNRSVGLPARISDSLLVVGFTALVVYATRSPMIGAVAALAFLLDAVLPTPLRRQLAFAVLCIGTTGVVTAAARLDILDQAALTTVHAWLIAMVGTAYSVTVLLRRQVKSVGDATGSLLSAPRVRAGMLMALLIALAGSMYGPGGFDGSALLWATLAGVVVGELGEIVSRGR